MLRKLSSANTPSAFTFRLSSFLEISNCNRKSLETGGYLSCTRVSLNMIYDMSIAIPFYVDK
jgi:hypothetical protein